jgi:hypothetical protein
MQAVYRYNSANSLPFLTNFELDDLDVGLHKVDS